jgi:aryl-alcohol dehydrogenase-like predicted oxidoreductase
MKIQRRSFLKQSALGVSGLLVGAPLARAAAKQEHFDPYATVPLGRSGLKVSRFCLGTGMTGGKRESNHTRMGQEKFNALVHGAYERGVRMYDLADSYGTHPYAAEALKGIPRDRYQIVTKIWFRPGGIPEPERPDADVVVNRFLKELRTDYIDLLLLHCAVSANWPQELRRQMDIVSKLQAKGVVRAKGVSCHSLVALSAAATEQWVDSVHTRINPFGIAMDGPPEQVVPVLRQMHANGKGVVGMKIIGEGKLRDDEEKKDQSIRYPWTQGLVDLVTVGFEKTAELDDFAVRLKQVPKTA